MLDLVDDLDAMDFAPDQDDVQFDHEAYRRAVRLTCDFLVTHFLRTYPWDPDDLPKTEGEAVERLGSGYVFEGVWHGYAVAEWNPDHFPVMPTERDVSDAVYRRLPPVIYVVS